MSKEIIFCTRWSDQQRYEWFWHEADVLLYALGQEVRWQNLTSEQAREIYARHYCRPGECLHCNRIVHHWSCSCGSNVLFDKLEDPWPQHPCFKAGRAVSVKPVNTNTYGVLSVVCTRCGKAVRKKDKNAHDFYTHRIGKRPNDLARRKASPPPSGASSVPADPRVKNKPKTSKRTAKPAAVPKDRKKALNGSLVRCGACGKAVTSDALDEHRLRVHGGALIPTGTIRRKIPKRSMARCKLCSSRVRLDKLDGHMRRVHSSQGESNGTG